jgi:hypothetical protein
VHARLFVTVTPVKIERAPLCAVFALALSGPGVAPVFMPAAMPPRHIVVTFGCLDEMPYICACKRKRKPRKKNSWILE